MSLKDRLSRRLGAGLAVLGAVGLAGCGSTNDGEGPADGTGGTSGTGRNGTGSPGGSGTSGTATGGGPTGTGTGDGSTGTTTGPGTSRPAGTTAPPETTDAPGTTDTPRTTGGPTTTESPETTSSRDTTRTETTTTPPPPTETTSSEECEEREREAREKLDEVQNELFSVNYTLDERRKNEAVLELLVEQLRDGFSTETMDQAKSVGKTLRESVVTITGYRDGSPAGGGTGWILDDGYVVTNSHVVYNFQSPVDKAVCNLPDGTEFEATVAGFTETRQPDVALLETDFTDAPSVSVGDESTLSEGQPLVQVGHPGFVGNWVFTIGKFGASEEIRISDTNYTDLHTTVQGLSGVSGSPVATLDGDVVGLTWGGSPPMQRDFGEHPGVAPDVVYDVPLSPIGISTHTAISDVVEVTDGWR